MTGAASYPWYNGTNIVTVSPDVIVVTTNYRVNTFGWMASTALPAAGNLGLEDQRAAMTWVQVCSIVCWGSFACDTANAE